MSLGGDPTTEHHGNSGQVSQFWTHLDTFYAQPPRFFVCNMKRSINNYFYEETSLKTVFECLRGVFLKKKTNKIYTTE